MFVSRKRAPYFAFVCCAASLSPLAAEPCPGNLDALVDGAFRSCMARYWSPRTSLVYSCDLKDVKKAAEFKNGLHDWSENARPGDGYGFGMADCAIIGAVALSGCVDRWEVLSGEEADASDSRMAETAEWAAKLARGLLNLVTKHKYTGFVARGLCEEDGTSICSLSSIDQHTHWVHGLYRYSHSPMARPDLVRSGRSALPPSLRGWSEPSAPSRTTISVSATGGKIRGAFAKCGGRMEQTRPIRVGCRPFTRPHTTPRATGTGKTFTSRWPTRRVRTRRL